MPKQKIAQKRLEDAHDALLAAANRLSFASNKIRNLTYASRESFRALELSEDVIALLRSIDLMRMSGQAELDHEPTMEEMKELE